MNLAYHLERWLHRRRIESVKLGEQSLQLIKGTHRLDFDYDDAWLYKLGEHCNRIYDVGSNIGQAAVLLSHSGPKHIVLIDPNQEALSTAAENLILNHWAENAHFITGFVGAKADEEVDFWSFGIAAAGSVYASHSPSARKRNAVKKVPTTTLENIYQRVGWAPDLVKIDVEGAEAMVLEGIGEGLLEMTPWLFVEMHANPELSMKANADKVLDWCKNHKYKAWYLKTHEELIDSKIIEGRGRCHLLLLHQSEPYPDFLRPIQQGASIAF